MQTYFVAVAVLVEICLFSPGFVSARRGTRAQGLTLGESCSTDSSAIGFYPCLMLGSVCTLANGAADGICNCKPSFRQTVAPDLPIRCVPIKTTPLNDADCESNEDCVDIVGSVCRQVGVKRTCQCKDEFEYDTPSFSCKVAYCGGKPTGYCQGKIPNSVCNSNVANAGKCACVAPRGLVQLPSGTSTCVEPMAIDCNTDTIPCPAVALGTVKCQPTTGATGAGKCSCDVGPEISGTIKLGASGQLECAANTIGSGCVVKADCPGNVACLKKNGAAMTAHGICGCANFQKPHPENTRCDSTLATCCKRDLDCGLGSAPTVVAEKAFKCIRSSPGGATGICACPPTAYWNGLTCAIIPIDESGWHLSCAGIELLEKKQITSCFSYQYRDARPI